MPDITYLFIWRGSTPALTDSSLSCSKTAVPFQGQTQLSPPSVHAKVIYLISKREACTRGTGDLQGMEGSTSVASYFGVYGLPLAIQLWNP